MWNIDNCSPTSWVQLKVRLKIIRIENIVSGGVDKNVKCWWLGGLVAWLV